MVHHAHQSERALGDILRHLVGWADFMRTQEAVRDAPTLRRPLLSEACGSGLGAQSQIGNNRPTNCGGVHQRLLGRRVIGLACALAVAMSAVASIENIDEFLAVSPVVDPALDQIRKDFEIRRNGSPITGLPSSGRIADLTLGEYTDEVIVLQGLRVLYYMDQGRNGHLPWTSETVYHWLSSKIDGIDVRDGSGSYCCEYFGGKTFIVVAAQNDFNRDFDRKWEGISGNIGLYVHEARHVDGFGHSSCCGINGGCDDVYDETRLAPYALQYWLERAWLTGQISVGIGCLAPMRVAEISAWHLGACNGAFRSRFCTSAPPLLTMPEHPGGACRPKIVSANAAGDEWMLTVSDMTPGMTHRLEKASEPRFIEVWASDPFVPRNRTELRRIGPMTNAEAFFRVRVD